MNQQQLLPTPMTKKFLDNKPKFNDQGSFRERLEFLIKWQPNGIHGLELEHLQSTPDDPNSASVPKPVLVRIKRECLTDLVKILDRPKKSIQRGLATFFRSTFGLHNVSNYNREWLIFGTRSDQELKKKRKTKKKKTALKGKRNLQNNKIKSQPNEGNTQNGNNKNVDVDANVNVNVNVDVDANVNAIGNKTKKRTGNGNGKRRKTDNNSGSGSRVGSISRKRHKNSQGKSKKKQEKAKNKIQTEDAILQEKQKPQIKKKKIKKKINLRTSKKIKTKLQIKKKTDPKLKIEKKNKKISKIPKKNERIHKINKLEIIKIPNYNLQKQKIRKRKRLFSNVELSNNEKPIKKSSQRKSDNSKKRNILKTRNQLQQGESENENLNELLKQDEPKANNTNEESDKDQEQSPEHYLNIDTIQNDETISMFNQQDLNSNIDEQANQESGLQEFVEGFFVVRDPFVFVEDSQFFWLQSQLETEQFLEFL
ncbi:hypothetical protein M0813_27693 [Anaeramoeba flamelloides]|uniref:Uncharacterized protein n=1 Tax=Anaeramoeba flamelloides TaxID=1746091 RepID=A0ABQ8XWF0_9EUKA|nr:hypothetical protein M0813_27693 [Anaeramoeba flamelloides]